MADQQELPARGWSQAELLERLVANRHDDAWTTPELAAKRWWFDNETWGGGLYGSPTPAGTRPAPPIAGAWAALHALGEDGYLRLADQVRDTVRLLQRGIERAASGKRTSYNV